MAIVYTGEGDYPKGHYTGWISKTKIKNLVKSKGYDLVNAKNNEINHVKTGSSGFIKDPITGRLIYFSCDADCSYNPNRILYRTAKHDRDYSGGTNHFCALEQLPMSCEELFQRDKAWE